MSEQDTRAFAEAVMHAGFQYGICEFLRSFGWVRLALIKGDTTDEFIWQIQAHTKEGRDLGFADYGPDQNGFPSLGQALKWLESHIEKECSHEGAKSLWRHDVLIHASDVNPVYGSERVVARFCPNCGKALDKKEDC